MICPRSLASYKLDAGKPVDSSADSWLVICGSFYFTLSPSAVLLPAQLALFNIHHLLLEMEQDCSGSDKAFPKTCGKIVRKIKVTSLRMDRF